MSQFDPMAACGMSSYGHVLVWFLSCSGGYIYPQTLRRSRWLTSGWFLLTRTSAGVYVLSASRLSDKVVLVKPGAVFCHHHGLGSPLSPSVNHLRHGIGVWNRKRPSKQATQEDPFRLYYDAANTHWVHLVWLLMGLFGPFSIKQLAEGQENKFDWMSVWSLCVCVGGWLVVFFPLPSRLWVRGELPCQ